LSKAEAKNVDLNEKVKQLQTEIAKVQKPVDRVRSIDGDS